MLKVMVPICIFTSRACVYLICHQFKDYKKLKFELIQGTYTAKCNLRCDFFNTK